MAALKGTTRGCNELTQNDDKGHLNGPDLGLWDDAPRAASAGALLTAAWTGATVQQLCKTTKKRTS